MPAACGPRIPSKADLLITGGVLYDGTGSEGVLSDIAISGDKVVYVGKSSPKNAGRCQARRHIDATGYVVSPGFIDPHTHQESTLLKGANEPYLRMGVTTVITGMCGSGMLPASEFFQKMEEQGIGTNCATFTGHNTIRQKVMGGVARPATQEEIQAMRTIFRQELEAGSFGLSTGLYYTPGCFAETEEVVELCREMAPDGGIYTTHVRNENKFGEGLYNSIREALEIGSEAGVQVNISHIKCLGKSVWGLSDDVIKLIESYREGGLKVTADQYPYIASETSLVAAVVPSWAREGGRKGMLARYKKPEELARIKADVADLVAERGGPESILISGGNSRPEYVGRTLAAICDSLGLPPVDAVIKITTECSPSVNTFVMNEEDVANYMKQPWVMTCSDGTFGLHPRAAGTYPEKISKYVLDRKVLTLPDMIWRSSGMVAETYRIPDRGVIRPGAYADIIIFKPEELRANATYLEPTKFATGFRLVVVNGEIAVENDNYTGALSGKIIKKDNNGL